MDNVLVRTAADLERKYNLRELAKNAETSSNQLIHVQTELSEFITATTGDIEAIETKLDGKVDTYYYSGVPSLSNLPASEWSQDEYLGHEGDLYYDKTTGYCYRFTNDNGYSWVRIKDSEITTALSAANAAQDTADGKRRIFTSQPTTPYDKGDLWVGGSNGDIKKCKTARASGNYVSTDWDLASKYTDDTIANAIVTEMGGTTTTALQGQVKTIMQGLVKFVDLKTGGSTEINGSNITTGTINASQVAVTNINASNITTGTLSANLIKGGRLVINGNYIDKSSAFLEVISPQSTSAAPIGTAVWGNGIASYDYSGDETACIRTEGPNGYAELWGHVVNAFGFNNVSLEEKKKNFERFNNALEIIKDIDIYKYHYKGEDDETKKHIGVVIGDNYKYRKEITNQENDSIDLYSFVGLCCQAIKEQQEQIEELKKELGKER